MSPKKRNWIAPLVLIALFFYMAVRLFSMNSAQPKVEYRTIVDYFRNRQVTEYELDFGTGELTMKLNDEKKSTVTYTVPNLSLFLQDTHELVEQYNAEHPDAPIKQYYDAAEPIPWWVDMLPLLFTVLLMGAFWYFLMKRSGGGSNPMAFAKLKPKQQDPHNRVTFADVAGADEEKEELEEIVQFLKDPGKFNALGARIPKGVLLMGPPGTGKTLLAKAVAGEAGVPFFSISGSDFVEMFVGVGASRVRDLFEQAKKSAPSIVFIDEIDAVGRHRGSGLGGGHDEREQTLNQLLVEMDGFAVNEGVVVLAATNRVDILDPALLRPGRFDRQVYVGLPDIKGREEILKIHAKGKPLAEDVELGQVARSTAGFTGADLENLLNEAALLAGRRDQKFITEDVIHEAVIKVIAGPEKRSRVIPEIERKLTAYHEAGHAIVAMKLQNCDPVHEVSIIPRGMAGGYTMMLPKEDKNYVTRGKLEDSIAMSLGGRVAEKLRMGDISTGAYSDLQAATQTAQKMVTEYGMSEDIGPIFLGGQTEVFIGRDWGHQRNYSESLAARVDAEVQRILQEQFLRAEKAVGADMEALDRVANMLMEYERVTGEEFAAVYHGADPKDVIKPETTQDTAAETMKTSADTEAEQTVQTAETTEDNAEAEPTEER